MNIGEIQKKLKPPECTHFDCGKFFIDTGVFFLCPDCLGALLAENAKLKEELSEGTWDRDHPHVLRCRGKTKAEFYERLLALLPDDFPLKAENYRLRHVLTRIQSILDDDTHFNKANI
ncbi:MAG TPA: hypothetical protein HPP87_10040 [Planctomycetes bacterium]|nr:hypothetical protein [Planctomycetota bacterium]